MPAVTAAAAIRVRAVLERLAGAALWLVLIGTSALIVVNSVPYFAGDGPFAFLDEKGALAAWLPWRAAFYTHVAAALVCLVAGPAMFSRALLRRAPKVHRWAGRVYVLAVLGWAAPAGLFLAAFAKGGVVSRLGFFVLGALWLATTWQGYRTAVARRFREHARWMVFSYAMATSAPSFRILQIAMDGAGFDVRTAYVGSVWLSLGVSIALGWWWSRGLPAGPAVTGGGSRIRAA